MFPNNQLKLIFETIVLTNKQTDNLVLCAKIPVKPLRLRKKEKRNDLINFLKLPTIHRNILPSDRTQ